VPDGKQPQDRKPKAVDAAKAEATDAPLTLEFEGVTYIVDREAFNDVEVMENIGDMQQGQPYLLPIIVRSMLGDAQWQQFKKAARDPKTGRVSGEKLAELFSVLDDAAGNLDASPGS